MKYANSSAQRFTRRQFAAVTLGSAVASASGPRIASAAEPQARADGVISIKHQGVLIGECTLPGETRASGVVPRHANCIQVRRDRWLIVYSTHGYRGVDDERSIIYQLRSDAPDGPLLKEGFLARATENWRPSGIDLSGLGANQSLFKQHGHMVAFGVPEGALIDGQPAPHAGVFVAKWRTVGRVLDCERDFLLHSKAAGTPGRATQAVEWVQFQLNRQGTDIGIIRPVAQLRQAGFEKGPAFCSAADAGWMNQSFTPPVPFNQDCTEWADCNHFAGGRLAAIKYRFNAKLGYYEWVETGPWLASPDCELMEASLVETAGGWVIAARKSRQGGVAWVHTENPFDKLPAPTLPAEPKCNAPLTVFKCGDGVLRLFTGDGMQSPYHNARDPLYCWNVDVEQGFACTDRRMIYDSVQSGLPIRKEVVPKIDFCELFPAQGRTQLVVHGVSTRGYNFPYEGRSDIPAINAEEKKAAGIYYATITYREPCEGVWRFS